MDNQNQQIETPQSLNQMSSVNGNSSKSKIVPIAAGLIFVFVAIAAYIFGTKQNQTVVSNEQNSTIPITIPSLIPVDETANWKTYMNTNAGYSFKYPSDYQIMENQKKSVDGVTINTPNTTTILSPVLPSLNTNMQISIHYENQAGDLSGVEVAKKFGLSINATPYTIYGKSGFIFADTPLGAFGSTIIFITANNRNYTFTIESQTPYAQHKQYLDQILSTFKFTDQTPTQIPIPTVTPPAYQITQGNQLNTYINNVYNFSFNLPKSLFLYNSQSSKEYASFLEKQGNTNAIRMSIEVFKNPNNLTLEEIEAKYNLKVNNNQTFDLEKTTISGKKAIVVAGNKSMRELCNLDDDQKRRVVLVALVKASNFVLIFSTNNTCDTFKTDWFNIVVSSITLK